jgi:capsular polysaccharide export protein
MWSGIRVIEKAAAKFAEDNSIPKIFFELSNLPNKIFADPMGTNANSLLFENPSILDTFGSDKNIYSEWRSKYIESNLRTFSVPQSKNTAQIDYAKNIWDLLGVKLFNYQKFEPVFSIEKYKNKLKNKHSKFDYDKVDLNNMKYIFFPLQVSDDAQILLNSSVDNLTAIEKLSKTAAEKGLNLLVKPHPAERNFDYVLKLNKLKSKLNFKFITGNMFQIMNNAEEVYTINSTAGLQAKILGRTVHFFGKSFYSKLNEEQIEKYVTSYLLDLNFWSETQNLPNLVKTIEKRAVLN